MASNIKFNEVACAMGPGGYAVQAQDAFLALEKVDAAVADANDDAGDFQFRYGAYRRIQAIPDSLN
jgi:hypothetical protein